MTAKKLWISASDPVRINRGGYEFESDCGPNIYVIEIDREITAGLNEDDAQSKLRKLRRLIQDAARMRHQMDEPYLEYEGSTKERHRVALTAEDLLLASR